jgi:F-type H+-transporting ATPase subunit delta
MITGSLARRYAKAIFDIGTTQGDLDKLGSDLRSFAKAMHESPELLALLTNPAIRRGDRKKVIEGLLAQIAVQSSTRNLVFLLLDGERLSSLPGISRELDSMIEARAGRVTAELVSAKPLDPVQRTQITAALEKLSGKKVTVRERLDPELLGGVVAKLGDTVYDGSLRNDLRKMSDELTK